MTKNTKVATLTGLLDLSKPDPENVSLRDISLKLATTPRWGGVFDPPLSVAQHSVLVADALPARLRIYGLLHDAHEAYTGDITSPVEAHFSAILPGFGEHLKNLKEQLDRVIRTAFEVPSPSIDDLAAIHEADMRMAATEWFSRMPARCGPSPIAAKRFTQIGVKPLAWPDAESRFRQAVECELGIRSWEVAA